MLPPEGWGRLLDGEEGAFGRRLESSIGARKQGWGRRSSAHPSDGPPPLGKHSRGNTAWAVSRGWELDSTRRQSVRSNWPRAVLAGLVGVIAVIALAACGGGGSATPTPTPTSSGGGATPTATAAQPTATPTSSFDAASYFKGKTITVVVPYGAGGGTDIIARALAAQWPKFIPGNPSVTVVNKTPEVAGLNYVWGAKADGLTIGTMSATNWYQQKFLQGANYSAGGWNIVGAVSKADFAILGRHFGDSNDMPYTSLDQAENGTKGPIKQGTATLSVGQLQASDVSLMWLSDTLNLPMQYYGITNYNSSSEALVDFQQGNVNILTRNGGGGWAGLPTTRPGWEKNGNVFQVVSMTNPSTKPGDSPEAGPWTAKNVVDYLTPAQQQTWTGLMAYPSFDKPYVLPPNTPADVVKAVQDSFWAMVQDPTAAAAIQKAMGGIPFEPTQGAADTAETQKNAPLYESTYPSIATNAQEQAWITKYGK